MGVGVRRLSEETFPGHLPQPCPEGAGRPLSQSRGRLRPHHPHPPLPFHLSRRRRGLKAGPKDTTTSRAAPSRGIYYARWGRRPHGVGGWSHWGGGPVSRGHPFPFLWPHTPATAVLAARAVPPPSGTPPLPRLSDELGRALGEDVVGLVLHQHLHAPDVGAPHLQAVLHALDLRAEQGHGASGCRRGSRRRPALLGPQQ